MKQETLEPSSLLHTLEEFKILSDDIKDDFIEEVAQIMFKAGAAWQRNHVWHSNAEMPSSGMGKFGLGKACLFAKGENIFVGHASQSASGTYYFTDGSGTWHPVKGVTRWLYLNDILPTPFDEIVEENKDVLQRLKDK